MGLDRMLLNLTWERKLLRINKPPLRNENMGGHVLPDIKPSYNIIDEDHCTHPEKKNESFFFSRPMKQA